MKEKERKGGREGETKRDGGREEVCVCEREKEREREREREQALTGEKC